MVSSRSYYQILGVNQDAALATIKKRYYHLMMKYHPDKNVSLSKEEQIKAEGRAKEIIKAYEILSDANKRQEYDKELAKSQRFSWFVNLLPYDLAKSFIPIFILSMPLAVIKKFQLLDKENLESIDSSFDKVIAPIWLAEYAVRKYTGNHGLFSVLSKIQVNDIRHPSHRLLPEIENIAKSARIKAEKCWNDLPISVQTLLSISFLGEPLFVVSDAASKNLTPILAILMLLADYGIRKCSSNNNSLFTVAKDFCYEHAAKQANSFFQFSKKITKLYDPRGSENTLRSFKI